MLFLVSQTSQIANLTYIRLIKKTSIISYLFSFFLMYKTLNGIHNLFGISSTFYKCKHLMAVELLFGF